MDSKNANRIDTVIGTLNSVVTKDADTARWIIDIIDQLEEIVDLSNGARVDKWRESLGGGCEQWTLNGPCTT